MITLSEAAESASGVYSISEVARYIGVRPQTLRPWFFPRHDRKELLKPSVARGDDGAWLTFHDFLQAYAVKLLKDKNVSPRSVRDALQAAAQNDIPYPISMRGIHVYVEKGAVFFQKEGEAWRTRVTGRGKGNRDLSAIVDQFQERMIFGQDGIARAFVVFEEDNSRVLMDPTQNFGEPTVEGTPYRAITLYNALKAEESMDAVVRIYEVLEAQVNAAVNAVKKAPEFRYVA